MIIQDEPLSSLFSTIENVMHGKHKVRMQISHSAQQSYESGTGCSSLACCALGWVEITSFAGGAIEVTSGVVSVFLTTWC